MKVITASDGVGGHMERYAQQLLKGQVELYPMDVRPFNWANRLAAYYQAAKEFADEILIFTDAWDVLFFGKKTELMDKVDELLTPNSIVFGAEVNVWPAGTAHGILNGSWENNRYINAGMILTRGYTMVEFLGDHNMHILHDSIDDQAIWHQMANRPEGEATFRLDGQCKLFQNLYMVGEDVMMNPVGKRPLNRKTGTNPMFIHGNGKTPLDRFL